MIKDTTNIAINMKKRIFAIPAILAAMPPKPKRPATIARIKNIKLQLNIASPPEYLNNDHNAQVTATATGE